MSGKKLQNFYQLFLSKQNYFKIFQDQLYFTIACLFDTKDFGNDPVVLVVAVAVVAVRLVLVFP